MSPSERQPEVSGLVKIRDKYGRLWLLPVAANPIAHPVDHRSEPMELRMLKAAAGPLIVEEWKVVEGE